MKFYGEWSMSKGVKNTFMSLLQNGVAVFIFVLIKITQLTVLMKKNVLLLAFLTAMVCFTELNAQNCDPWIVNAYKQLYQRNPTAEECNIRNYNNGSWNSYNELVSYIKAYQNKAKTNTTALKGDPWILSAYNELYRRQPNVWELNIKNYNNGSWNSYNELKKYIQDFQNNLRNQKLEIRTSEQTWGKHKVTGFFLNGRQVAVNLVSVDGGNVVAAGGLNVISAGGGNVVSAGGGNVVAVGGGNIRVADGMPGVNFGGRYTVQSAGTQVIPTSGQGALIIR